MSTKLVAVVATTLAVLAVAQSESDQIIHNKGKFSIDQVKNRKYPSRPIRGDIPAVFDEKKPNWTWTTNCFRPLPESLRKIKWEEEGEEEEGEQKLRLKKIVKGIKKVNNIVNKAQQVGLLEEDQDDEAKANWHFDAGVSGGAGGRPQWKVGIEATWKMDEEEEQFVGNMNLLPKYCGVQDYLRCLRSLDAPVKMDEEEEQKVQHQCAALLVPCPAIPTQLTKTAQQPQLLDEEEYEQYLTTNRKPCKGMSCFLKSLEEDEEAGFTNFNFAPKPQLDFRKQFRTWDEEQRWGSGFPGSSTGPYNPVPRPSIFEEDSEQGFGSKLDKFLGRVDHTLDTFDRIKGVFDEEEQAEKTAHLISFRKVCLRGKKAVKAAVEAGVLDREQGFGSRLDRTLERIDRTLDTVDRIRGRFNK